ncbi:diguanylate cyclase with PAS/PAC sensor [Petrotoga mobilis SJ95]|uniref:Diguanylate cyclase with PAS/PAC sensor n=1 Tax=Petrotoga mobilis (strain DSM 10674 / SJ95) TaxID=403833 RepID=A9BGU2_PETMO|nr:diguanylate cyclase [Petrotoga mobilis]ABX32523.1 diguanylate cyclase with PAS/PAC sensor [Petrotoga mobilis SJ95]
MNEINENYEKLTGVEKDFILSQLQKNLEDSKNESFEFVEENFPSYILDDLNDLILIMDCDRKIVFVNKKINNFGFSKKDFIGKEIITFFEVDVKKQIEYFFRRHNQNKLLIFKSSFSERNGEKIPFEFKLENFRLNDENFYILIGKDLSESEKYKKEIEIIQKSQETIRKALEVSQIGIWEWDVNCGKFSYDERYKEILGYTKDPFEGKWEKFEESINKEDTETLIKNIREHFLTKTSKFEGTYRIKDVDDNYKWFLSRGRVLERNKFGLPMNMVGAYLELTEDKKQIEEMKKEKDFIEKVVENMGQGLVLLDFDFNVKYANKSFYKMVEFDDRILDLKKVLDQRDWESFNENMQNLKRNTNNAISFESNLVTKSGVKVPVLITGVTYEEVGLSRIILVITDITEKKKLEEILKKYATFDDLTGSYNRRAGFYALEKYFQLAKRRQEPLSVVFIDIDNLKYINDNYGHDAGDYILRKVTDVLKNTLRESDLIIRVGGDEFVLGLPNAEEIDVHKIFERILSQLKEVKVDGNVRINLSYGVSEYKDFQKDINLESLIKEADNKMYEMKKAKK